MINARLRTLALVSLCSAVVAGCGGSESTSGGGKGGTLRIGIASTTVESLNPFAGQSSLALMTYRVLYPHLMEYNKAHQLVDDFATSSTLSENGRTWTFTTRPGARWSDGTPLTAADAAFTINTIIKYQNGPAAELSSYVTGISHALAISPNSLQVKLSTPTATVLDQLAQIPILPHHIWGSYATGSGAQLKTFGNSTPVAGGPFLLKSYKPNQSIVFTRNPTYYGTPAKLASFGLVFLLNNDAVVNAIQGGEVDVALDIPATTIKTLRGDSALRVLSTPGYDTILLGINSNPNRSTHRELLNPSVREAIALGLNRQQISNTVTLGTGGVTQSVLSPNQPYHDSSIGPPVYNLTKANEILDKLGYKRGSDGIRVANGHKMSYTLLFGNTTTGAPLDVNLIVNGMQALGIKVTPIESDPKAYTAAINAGHYTKFDFSVDDYGPDFEPNHYLALPTCAQFGAENETGFCNKSYDALYAAQSKQTGAVRRATIDAMQQLLLKEKPLIPIYAAPDILAVRSNVTGVQPTPIVIIDYESKQWIDEVTIK